MVGSISSLRKHANLLLYWINFPKKMISLKHWTGETKPAYENISIFTVNKCWRSTEECTTISADFALEGLMPQKEDQYATWREYMSKYMLLIYDLFMFCVEFFRGIYIVLLFRFLYSIFSTWKWRHFTRKWLIHCDARRKLLIINNSIW